MVIKLFKTIWNYLQVYLIALFLEINIVNGKLKTILNLKVNFMDSFLMQMKYTVIKVFRIIVACILISSGTSKNLITIKKLLSPDFENRLIMLIVVLIFFLEIIKAVLVCSKNHGLYL